MANFAITVGAESIEDLATQLKAIVAKLESKKDSSSAAAGSIPKETHAPKVSAKKGNGGDAIPPLAAGEEEDALDIPEAAADMEKEVPKLSLTKHVIPAFKKYAEENSREDALKVLKSFKVKSVSELKPTQYKAVLNSLGA